MLTIMTFVDIVTGVSTASVPRHLKEEG